MKKNKNQLINYFKDYLKVDLKIQIQSLYYFLFILLLTCKLKKFILNRMDYFTKFIKNLLL